MVIEETENKIDRHQVELMIADWKKRLSDLYATMRYWLKDSDNALKFGPAVPLYEELMFLSGVPETLIDTADIYNKDKQIILTIMPIGLWVIGANGRVDLLSLKGVNYLVDFAPQFKEPKWKIYKGVKEDWVEFNQQEFLTLIN